MADLGFRFRRSWKATHRRSREFMMVAQGRALDRSSRAGAHHSHPALQPRLRVLQRVRRFLQARAAGRHAAAPRPSGRAGHHHHHAERRRAAAASRARRDHRAHSQSRHHRGHDHQRISAHRGPHPAAEPRRPRAHADLHRQRQPGRRVEEEPEGAGQEAAIAVRTRRVSRQHQFRGGRRHSQPQRRARSRARAPSSWDSPRPSASFTMATANCSRSSRKSAKSICR